MNAVEIEEAISALAERPFDPVEFPYEFLQAFGRKATEIKRLKSGHSNKSDLGGVLQRNHIHIKVCSEGDVSTTLAELRESPATAKSKARFLLATDGVTLEAEEMGSDIAPIACEYERFPDHFGFFLPLAGISTVKQIRESAFDIKATGRLNRLYVELLKDNPEWGTAARRHDMNHFMARLIFCFFAEDTDIFTEADQFTGTIERMSEKDSSNTHEVIAELFQAMNTKAADRAAAGIPRWANVFPYVNGGLFSGGTDVPRFSKIARSYLLHIGNLDWTKINPDIFGSMIQAVADDEERGALGMHYTSVPNILKVLNPLFLDDLRQKLEEAGDSPRKLLNLRNRMAKIRVFDPACGSGNFLVIAYKELRSIEAEINTRRGEADRRTEIPLTNFRGIELRDFPAEIARLALIIAEYQCDVTYRGQKEALAEFLPLDAMNWITCGNALRLDWLSICPPTGMGVKHHADDLFMSPVDQAEIDFENEGGETYICGNPPYLGARDQDTDQKNDIKALFESRVKNWKSLDYVSGWFIKAADYGTRTQSVAAFVATNSVCQGIQVSTLWPLIFQTGHQISFAYPSFKWSNLASHNAGVTVVIVGIQVQPRGQRRLFIVGNDGDTLEHLCSEINAYLSAAENILVEKYSKPLGPQSEMTFGNTPIDGGNLLLSRSERNGLGLSPEEQDRFVRRIYGSAEFIRGLERYCLWIEDEHLAEARSIEPIRKRIDAVRELRLHGGTTAQAIAEKPHQFQRMKAAKNHTILVAAISSENRPYLPCGVIDKRSNTTNKNYALYDAPFWNMALIASRLHWVWIGTVCVRMRTDFSYSNTLGWNTFPLPKLTEKNKEDLTRCAEDILLAREAHFPATIADLYDPEKMPADLRAAHDRNDETLERIYIGRRFRNDAERLEKLFELYTRMTKKGAA
ncbi:DNA methyltransferase [Phaeobacter sp. 22II1-1F12B]|uniref:class I SAM-dependent DNA methyltransferase n=1 Tax=Phaeobacter sp. 22II1-1F12B TaxID=1317111 RepID=UPI000B520A13|nr:DNA methyltransferase [Phaeobacter sp. 22II1-1F12B]OWU68768.1 lactate dehydrogenase [Phaeobacter sp. 22II1-1F12B]